MKLNSPENFGRVSTFDKNMTEFVRSWSQIMWPRFSAIFFSIQNQSDPINKEHFVGVHFFMFISFDFRWRSPALIMLSSLVVYNLYSQTQNETMKWWWISGKKTIIRTIKMPSAFSIAIKIALMMIFTIINQCVEMLSYTELELSIT